MASFWIAAEGIWKAKGGDDVHFEERLFILLKGLSLDLLSETDYRLELGVMLFLKGREGTSALVYLNPSSTKLFGYLRPPKPYA